MDNTENEFYDLFRFLKNNPIYVVCSAIYYLFALFVFRWNVWVFFILAFLYGLSLMVVFSQLAEAFLRLLNNIRRLETSREKEYLRPLFQEVYDRAKAHYSALYDIDIYVVDSMTVNAFSIGLHTVAVTKGAMQTFSEDELKAIMAHEIAHIANLDTAALLYAIVGNGIFSFTILFLKMICWIVGFFWNHNRKRNALDFILDAVVVGFTFLMGIAMAIGDRKAELRADEYTITIGYGEDMVEALYLLEKISLSGNRSMIEKLLDIHPRVTARIENLEKKLGIQ